MSYSGFMAFDADSPVAVVGYKRTFPTAGEARAYERGWGDASVGSVAIEPYDAYLKGWLDYHADQDERMFSNDGEWEDAA